MPGPRQYARRIVGLVTIGLVTIPAVQGALAAPPPGPDTSAARAPFQIVEGRELDDRLPQPEDRYALAGGCYTIEAPGHGYVTRTGDGLALVPDPAVAEPFHFQATRLGQYLVATNEGPDTSVAGAWWDVRGYLAARGLLPELPELGLPLPGDGLLDAAPLDLPTSDEVTVASRPGEAADWRVVAAGPDPEASRRRGQSYELSLPAEGKALAVIDGALGLVPDAADATGFRFHHVADDDPGDGDPNGTACADWPEISTNTSGPPSDPKGSPVGRVRGFFEAHVHGMAFEFLGGEVHCGRPWHPYGVEYALPDCFESGHLGNVALEAFLSGADPTAYDPVGWPTFGMWPAHELLTFEQFYWKWLERAYHGGLRLLTNLLVENTALCQLYPLKRNSCNEMDSVRLQARRLYELQDYIDAQSGGPGEGWFRIVTTPAQARRVINAGRLAVVMGIEVSVIFDCGEVLGEPQCTREQLAERIQEAHDMGVRQVEIINKFDNALSGVTGDSGTTGVIVNQGNRYVTGHYWDMRTCPESSSHSHVPGVEGTQYDRTQLNPSDDTPLGEAEGVDVLAARLLQQFGGVTSLAVPAYPPGPHCNTAGLSELGEFALRTLIDHGIIFDPDHMSAKGQREALDLIANEIIPAENQAARSQHRAAIRPGLISSHGWANDVVYQRIYRLGGTVAPRTTDAAGFVDRWAQRRAWFDELAPRGAFFGMGYGADTNGFGSQPGPRPEPEQRVRYHDGWQAPIGGVTIHQQTSGVQTYDINTDGVAHYGLFADWFHELELAADQRHPELGGGDAIIDDMLNGAEDYLRMWERAVYGANDCVADQSTLQVEDVHALLGANLEGFLDAIGQPVTRDGAVYTYCVAGEDGRTQPVDVLFDDDGRVTRVQPSDRVEPTPPAASTAPVEDGHDHLHASPAAPTLPATGGGLAGAALLLLGATLAGSRVTRSGRDQAST